jgi:hypothetical protein
MKGSPQWSARVLPWSLYQTHHNQGVWSGNCNQIAEAPAHYSVAHVNLKMAIDVLRPQCGARAGAASAEIGLTDETQQPVAMVKSPIASTSLPNFGRDRFVGLDRQFSYFAPQIFLY